MAHALDQKIADRTLRLSEVSEEMSRLNDERIRLEAEISAYRDALQYVQPIKARRSRSGTSSRAKRGMSDTWVSLLRGASNGGRDEFDVDAVVSIGSSQGQELKRDSVRSQLAGFANRAVIERTAPGRFRVTPAGAKELGLDLADTEGRPPNENDPPEGGSDTGEGDTSLFETERDPLESIL